MSKKTIIFAIISCVFLYIGKPNNIAYQDALKNIIKTENTSKPVEEEGDIK